MGGIRFPYPLSTCLLPEGYLKRINPWKEEFSDSSRVAAGVEKALCKFH